jgi:hypothetical protein
MPLREVLVRTILSKIFRTALLGSGLGLCLLIGCTKEDKAKSATGDSSPSAALSPSQSASVPLARGIKGLELGMTLEQVGQLFIVKEDEHPLKAFLSKFLKHEVSRSDKVIPKRYFLVSPGKAKLPEGVMWADIKIAQNIVYQIGLHYEEASVEKIGWDGITSPYLAKYGKPTKNTGSGYTWTDKQTHLDIVSTGSTITVYFTDNAVYSSIL